MKIQENKVLSCLYSSIRKTGLTRQGRGGIHGAASDVVPRHRRAIEIALKNRSGTIGQIDALAAQGFIDEIEDCRLIG